MGDEALGYPEYGPIHLRHCELTALTWPLAWKVHANNDPLVERRIHSILLPPRCAPNSPERLVRDPPHPVDPRDTTTARNTGVLARPNPIRGIRGVLQQRLIPDNPDSHPIRLLRDRVRDRRRDPNRSRLGSGSNNFANHRPLETLPGFDPYTGTHRGGLVHWVDLCAIQSSRYRPVICRHGIDGCFLLCASPHRTGVPGRDHVPFLAGDREHHLLDGWTVARCLFHPHSGCTEGGRKRQSPL